MKNDVSGAHAGVFDMWVGRLLTLTVMSFVPAGVLVVSMASSGCSKSGEHVPAAPKMPDGWKVQEQATPSAGDELFDKVGARFPARIKTLRIVAYEVHGRRIVLNQMQAASPHDGDLIYRVLARKKPPFAYWRKGQIIYEFRGPKEAVDDIRAAHDLLAQ